MVMFFIHALSDTNHSERAVGHFSLRKRLCFSWTQRSMLDGKFKKTIQQKHIYHHPSPHHFAIRSQSSPGVAAIVAQWQFAVAIICPSASGQQAAFAQCAAALTMVSAASFRLNGSPLCMHITITLVANRRPVTQTKIRPVNLSIPHQMPHQMLIPQIPNNKPHQLPTNNGNNRKGMDDADVRQAGVHFANGRQSLSSAQLDCRQHDSVASCSCLRQLRGGKK